MRKLRKCRRPILLLLLFLVFLLFLFIVVDVHDPPRLKFPKGRLPGVSPYITTFPRPHGNREVPGGRERAKTVLLWTPFFGSKDWFTKKFSFDSCAVKTCRILLNKTEVASADAVLFNIRDFTSISELPDTHPHDQVWIVHSSEPPYYVYLNLDSLRNVFNWTSWYRADADIYSPYGYFAPINPSSRAQQPLPDEQRVNVSNSQHPANVLPDAYNAHDVIHDNSKNDDVILDAFGLHDLLVFWAASSCTNFNRRYKFVAELQRYLPIDKYGNCGDLECIKGSDKCHKLLRRYKFVLAFENGHCRDYITEKYWRALDRYQIPIVMGGANYSELAIPGSFIDVDSFTSTEELAVFILRVASDKDLYNSFHAWRSKFRKKPAPVVDWCRMCQALHDESKPRQVYSDLKGWMADDTCPLYSFLDVIRWTRDLVLFWLFGI